MSKQVNKTVIGAFVMSAFALLIAGLIALGSGKFLVDDKTVVMFFQGSIKGLDIGAPVMFRGVKIGSVSDIRIKLLPTDLDVWIPVYVNLEPARFADKWDDNTRKKLVNGKGLLDEFIQHGLRAQLQLLSMVTGKLCVTLDFYPDKPAVLTHLEADFSEIPTIPTNFQEITDSATRIIEEMKQLPLEELFSATTEVLQGINKILNSLEDGDAIGSLNQTLSDIRNLMKNIDNQVKPVGADLSGAVRDIRELVNNIDDQVPPLTAEIREVAGTARSALLQATETLNTTRDVLSESSPLRHELITTLESLSAAARSLQILAEFLQQHPESLLRGKKATGGK